MKRKKALKALKKIRKTCRSYSVCEACPLDKKGYCVLCGVSQAPEEWMFPKEVKKQNREKQK